MGILLFVIYIIFLVYFLFFSEEYVRKYCKCAKLLPVYPEPSDFHKGNQIIPVYPLRLCRPAIFLERQKVEDINELIGCVK